MVHGRPWTNRFQKRRPTQTEDRVLRVSRGPRGRRREIDALLVDGFRQRPREKDALQMRPRAGMTTILNKIIKAQIASVMGSNNFFS